MKTSKKWAITFTVINMVLIGVCCFFLLQKDRKAPEISFQENNLIYYSGMEQNRLLDGVTAYDLRDGDVTSRIVIEKIVQEEGRVAVYYAVTDYEGNVGKASRVFDAANETMGDAVLDIGTAGITGELEATPLPTTSPLPSPLPSSTPTQAPMPTPNREEEQLRQQQEEQQLRQQQEEEEHRRAEEIRREQEAAKAGNPQIILKSTTINTIAGQTPAWVEVIANFQDDKDGYEALFRNLKASKYDVNERGDHAVSLTTTDSDGNVSEPVTITVHVK